MTPHGVGVVERREVDSAAAVPVCSGCEGASDVGGQRASIEEGGEVVRGERVIAGEQNYGLNQRWMNYLGFLIQSNKLSLQ